MPSNKASKDRGNVETAGLRGKHEKQVAAGVQCTVGHVGGQSRARGHERVYERLALRMTALNIKSAFLNQPIEVAEIRSQFQTALGLGGLLPQLLLRFGYCDALPRSVRRPVEQVLA